MPRIATSLAVALAAVAVTAEIDPNAKGDPLFPDGHPNVTYLTDDNWDEQLAQDEKPWLVDFYHPFCPHCKHFVPTYEEVAAYYKTEGSIHIGAISCMDHVKCRRVGIKGFPTLMAFNFNRKELGENHRVVGTHTLEEVIELVDKIKLEAKINETGTHPPNENGSAGEATKLPTTEAASKEDEAKPGEQQRKEIWEESTKESSKITRIQDAASAFIFGLKQGVFMGREYLEDLELDALREWLRVVSQTFPGSINREIIAKLYERVQHIGLLDYDTWERYVNEWQASAADHFHTAESKLDFTGLEVPEWQRMSNLFAGQGNAYHACALYTCGQWNMFHMMTMNPPEKDARSEELMVSVIATMRRFMKHFFGCVQCRDHFLEYNNLDMVKKINSAENKPIALKRWLWEMHNAVNKRLVHPIWPKPNICPTCGEDGNWNDAEVEKWLDDWFGYYEMTVPPKTEAPITEAPSPSPDAQALRTEETEPIPTEAPATEATGYHPKHAEEEADEELKNPVTHETHSITHDTPVLDSRLKHENLNGVQAPPVSLFVWYILPVVAVAGYMIFVRSRGRSKSFRHLADE
ncbi:TPA: hypothetical protein N0F65_010250 [Lagenidium giganteum]|uniref:Sulfhydryl oxidase n=1 Tax=Lagenidium giganteum TaxID=4803 RepID=A0AAV2YK62_9STRA|nr:TPA: hypothetical protein N0F65_010250 [Lagenidium giganteum]